MAHTENKTETKPDNNFEEFSTKPQKSEENLTQNETSLVAVPATFVLTGPITIVSKNGVYDRIHMEMQRLCLEKNKFSTKSLLEYLNNKFQYNLNQIEEHDFAVIQLLQGCVLAAQLSGDIWTFHDRLMQLKREVSSHQYTLRHYSHVEAMLCYRLFFGYLYKLEWGTAQNLLRCAKDNLKHAKASAWTAKVSHMDAVMDLIFAASARDIERKYNQEESASEKLTRACEHCKLQSEGDTELIGYYSTYFSIQKMCIVLQLPIPLLVKMKLNIAGDMFKPCASVTEQHIAEAEDMLSYARVNKPHQCGVYSEDASFYLAVGAIYISLRKVQFYIRSKQWSACLEERSHCIDVQRRLKSYDGLNTKTVVDVILREFGKEVEGCIDEATFQMGQEGVTKTEDQTSGTVSSTGYSSHLTDLEVIKNSSNSKDSDVNL